MNCCKVVCVSVAALTIIYFVVLGSLVDTGPVIWRLIEEKYKYEETEKANKEFIIQSKLGVVAADDERCSAIGAGILRKDGHAVDAAVATALCLGVVNPMSSGIGGGAFIIVRNSATSKTEAFNSRETAPLAASKDMYEKNLTAKSRGVMSMGVPGEIAGLYEAWSKYGRLDWKDLVDPAIVYAETGFQVSPYLANGIQKYDKDIMADPGLSNVFAPGEKLLKEGDTCYNVKLAETLKAIANEEREAFYEGTVAQNIVKDVIEAGGNLTMNDMKNYAVGVTEAMSVNVMGYTILGMPPPSSGTLGLTLVLNILNSYGNLDFVKTSLGLHRFIEALKHMLAIRMNLGDPNFEDVTKYESDMLSPSFAEELQRELIKDHTTFGPDHYLSKWSQLKDHGTSHFSIVDKDRNAVSMTTSVNAHFGAKVLSPSTGIVLNNQMDDFSAPTENSSDKLPPAPANFIKPNKRPLSSMTPIIILKDNQLVGVLGASGGLDIVAAVVQVFLNHFIIGMEPLAAVRHPRVYHKLKPNEVLYEDWTLINRNHIELSKGNRDFLRVRSHELKGQGSGAICQFVVQTLRTPIKKGRKFINGDHDDQNGMLTAVSDPRKDGKPAASD